MLQLDQLSVSRGDRVLVAGLDLRLAQGELLHVRGANGCGKTSLLEVLSGLRHPAGGRLVRSPETLRSHWVGHRNALAAQLSPIENLQFWAGLNGLDPICARPALERLGVPASAARRAVRTLSAGQKRRSALARLLVEARALWLLDEPLDGLDADGIGVVAKLLDAHLNSGGAVVMTSHQPLPASLASARVLALDSVARAEGDH